MMHTKVTELFQSNLIRSFFSLFLVLSLLFNVHNAVAGTENQQQISELVKSTEEIRRIDYPQFYKNIEALNELGPQLTTLQRQQLQAFEAYKMALEGKVEQSLSIYQQLQTSKNINIRLRSYIYQIPILTQLKQLNKAISIIDKVLNELESNEQSVFQSIKHESLQVIGFFYQSVGEYQIANSYYQLINKQELSPKETCLLGYLNATNKLSAGFIDANDISLTSAQDYCYYISDLMMANGLTFAKARQLTKENSFHASIKALREFESQIIAANYPLHLLDYDLIMMENFLELEQLEEAEFYSKKIQSYKEFPSVKLKFYRLVSQLKFKQQKFEQAHQYLHLMNVEKQQNLKLVLKDKLAQAQVKHRIVEKNNRLNNLKNESEKNLASVDDLTNENKQLLDILIFDKVLMVILFSLIIVFYFAIFFLRAHKQGIINNQETDPLTGVFRRRQFTDLLASMVYKAKFSNRSVSVISFNFDNLKKLNMKHGVEEIDKVLLEVIRFIAEITSTEDMVARIGSDEFAIAIPNKTMESAEVIAYRILNNLNLICSETTGQCFAATASFGISDTNISNYVPKALLTDSSKALVKAKHGENKVCLFDASMAYKKHAKIATSLRYNFKI